MTPEEADAVRPYASALATVSEAIEKLFGPPEATIFSRTYSHPSTQS